MRNQFEFENDTVPAFPCRFVKFPASPQKQKFRKFFCFLWDNHCYLVVHYSISNHHYHPMLTLLYELGKLVQEIPLLVLRCGTLNPFGDDT